MEVEFSHEELSLALFALEGGQPPAVPDDPCANPLEACPIVEELEETFGWRGLSAEQRLARHLSKHLRQGWVDSGLLDLQQDGDPETSRSEIYRMQKQLHAWSCQIALDRPDCDLLYNAIAKLPRSAWISMPRTVWRLRRKLRRKTT